MVPGDIGGPRSVEDESPRPASLPARLLKEPFVDLGALFHFSRDAVTTAGNFRVFRRSEERL